MTVTQTGIPITDCDTCGHIHPVTRRHCPTCGLAPLFNHQQCGTDDLGTPSMLDLLEDA